MLKPSNYDNVQVSDYTPVKLGGHLLEIITVEETVSKSGKPLLIVKFDFAPNDEQHGIFYLRYSLDQREEPRWPAQATSYILPLDENNACSRALKSFINAVERSNPDFKVTWTNGPEFATQFHGKLVGGVFGNVQEEFNDEIFTRRKLRWFCSADSAKDASIPKDKLLDHPAPSTEDSETSSGFGPF